MGRWRSTGNGRESRTSEASSPGNSGQMVVGAARRQLSFQRDRGWVRRVWSALDGGMTGSQLLKKAELPPRSPSRAPDREVSKLPPLPRRHFLSSLQPAALVQGLLSSRLEDSSLVAQEKGCWDSFSPPCRLPRAWDRAAGGRWRAGL